jgi:hypothetical protein
MNEYERMQLGLSTIFKSNIVFARLAYRGVSLNKH